MSLFGTSASTASTPSTGLLFGASATPAASGSSSLFGSNTTSSTPSTGLLFGASATPSGASTSTPNLFGSSTPSSATTTPGTGGGLFGSGTGSLGSLGSLSSTGSSLGSLGSTATTAQQPSTSLFGSNAASQQPSTSLFGQTTSNTQTSTTATTSLFGQPAGATTSSLFGATSSLTPTNNTASTSLFGQPANNTTSSPFGVQQQPTSSLFGATTTATPPTTSNSLALISSSTNNQPRRPEEILDGRSVESRIAEYIQSISPESPYCKFLYWFYNYQGQVINPKLVPKPPNITDEQWIYAQSQNPDPNLFVPVAARSFNDLRERKIIQEKNIDLLFNNTMESLNNIKSLQNYLALQIQSQYEAMKKRNLLLLHKYIEVWSNLEIYRGKGRPVTNAEEHLLRRVKQILDILNQPNSLPSKVEEISNQVLLNNLESERINFQLRPESLESLFTLFKTMTNSVESMSNDLEQSLQDAAILKNELIKFR
ncbi:nucleoporin 54 [Heterostelium album PN500]|uniref:Nucleoporin 54 n=1 Tax=Heterostelium pallidum (strain ATCC 26659 / Pp 5 / PN500) TaxID=670386 RepID=D3AXR3_HETP5|nr:nucleoporin 54 [Heterostelium album PN500]EFA85740.1 nucleoporin 54 [Heterostelium album PN500]|eukprot:XP_020437846.1 nucleoporin 54 [Heterostelium album PN500]